LNNVKIIVANTRMTLREHYQLEADLKLIEEIVCGEGDGDESTT